MPNNTRFTQILSEEDNLSIHFYSREVTKNLNISQQSVRHITNSREIHGYVYTRVRKRRKLESSKDLHKNPNSRENAILMIIVLFFYFI